MINLFFPQDLKMSKTNISNDMRSQLKVSFLLFDIKEKENNPHRYSQCTVLNETWEFMFPEFASFKVNDHILFWIQSRPLPSRGDQDWIIFISIKSVPPRNGKIDKLTRLLDFKRRQEIKISGVIMRRAGIICILYHVFT